LGRPTAPYPREALDLSRLKYGNTPTFKRMVTLAARREEAKAKGRYPD
jgi:hypothetical protein